MHRSIISLAFLIFASRSFAAADLDTLQGIGSGSFKAFAEDFTAMASYKGVVPAEGLGLIGIDLGLEITVTKLENASLWTDAAGGEKFSDTLAVPKLHVHKGLPFNLDVGGFLATTPGSNIQLLGAEIRYGIIGGNVAIPAVGVRLSHTILNGVDQLDFSSTGLDISVSKGLTILTPYAGVGQVWSTSTPKGVAAILNEEKLSLNKLYAGANLNLGLINLALELDKTGGATSTSVKLGFRF